MPATWSLWSPWNGVTTDRPACLLACLRCRTSCRSKKKATGLSLSLGFILLSVALVRSCPVNCWRTNWKLVLVRMLVLSSSSPYIVIELRMPWTWTFSSSCACLAWLLLSANDNAVPSVSSTRARGYLAIGLAAASLFRGVAGVVATRTSGMAMHMARMYVCRTCHAVHRTFWLVWSLSV